MYTFPQKVIFISFLIFQLSFYINNVYYSEGVVVYINNSSFPPSDQDLLTVPTNTDTIINVNREVVKKIGPPYGDCDPNLENSDSVFYKLMKRRNQKYRRIDCLNLFYQNGIESTCNCSVHYLPKFDDNIKSCSTIDEITCAIIVYLAKDSFIDMLSDKCPIECELYNFKFSISSSAPLNPTYLNGVRKSENLKGIIYPNITNDELASSIALVTINYNHLGYTEINETPSYSVISLISNIGGTLGLFLGLSLLSLFESIEFLILLFQKMINSGQVSGSPNRST
jgi:hypothetical protein